MRFSMVICDDLEEQRLALSQMVLSFARRKGHEIGLDVFSSGQELLSRWQPEAWDIAFLDIYMEGLSGIETADLLRERDRSCALVFVTTSREHGMEGYRLQAMDYLVKPVTQEAVDDVLSWFVEQRTPERQVLELRADWNTVRLPLDSILYIELQDHAILFHAESGTVESHIRLEEVLAALGEEHFFHCHRSYYVNLAKVQYLDKLQFCMDDGSSVPISRSNLTAAKKAILDWDVNHILEL